MISLSDMTVRIEEERTIQWPKEKGQTWAAWTQLKRGWIQVFRKGTQFLLNYQQQEGKNSWHCNFQKLIKQEIWIFLVIMIHNKMSLHLPIWYW
jgi:hypothetical protein